MWIAGVVLIVLGAVFFYLQRSASGRLLEMAGAETATSASLKETADAVAKELGPGSFNQICELKGVIACDKPLLSEIRQIPCVYYRSQVTREYEEEIHERDPRTGQRHTRRERRTETVSSNTRQIEFHVEDQTGRTLVRPEGVEWDEEKAIDELRPPEPMMMMTAPTFRGTRYTEYVVPVGRRVYALGEARDSEGLALRKPEKGGRFLISLKSEEELSAAAKSSAALYKVLAPLFAIGGAVLTAIGLLR
jgi:hypothetical protein